MTAAGLVCKGEIDYTIEQAENKDKLIIFSTVCITGVRYYTDKKYCISI